MIWAAIHQTTFITEGRIDQCQFVGTFCFVNWATIGYCDIRTRWTLPVRENEWTNDIKQYSDALMQFDLLQFGGQAFVLGFGIHHRRQRCDFWGDYRFGTCSGRVAIAGRFHFHWRTVWGRSRLGGTVYWRQRWNMRLFNCKRIRWNWILQYLRWWRWRYRTRFSESSVFVWKKNKLFLVSISSI